MPCKKSKRKNIDKEVCPIPQKSNKEEKSGGCLQDRIVFSSNVDKLLSTQMLVLVKGTVCSGKTYCAQEVANARKLQMKTFQINDDLDSKTIFGSFTCTDVPGEFVWQPSMFSKCLKEECLILLKAFDTAHVDLVAAIFGLAETGSYKLQGEGICQVNERCRIIATMGSESSLNLLRDYPYTVDLMPLTSQEHSQILSMRFPQLDVIKEKVLAVFSDVCEEIKASPSKSDRQLNSSDLFRLCKRLHSFTDLSDNVLLLYEFLDVWVMHMADLELRMKVAQVVAQALSITEQQLSFVMNVRKPDIELQENVVVIGRTRLSRLMKHARQSPSCGLTRGYSQLMERIATCVVDDERREAVLLCGETGVGKTSVIQLLASYAGVPKLSIVNMSQDSEYSDLIGGYKPVSLPNVVRLLADDYLRLFQKNFNVVKNQKFLAHVNNCLSSDDFETFLQLVIGSVASSMDSKETVSFMKEWKDIGQRAGRLSMCFGGRSKLPAVPFAYVQGIVSEACERGHWLLIDEINLASAECLGAIVQVLDGAVKVNPKFRLFACMNPATDVGKKYLPLSARSKFTEFYVQDTWEMEELAIIVKNYLSDVDASTMKSIVEFYREVCVELPRKYSLRTLCRALALISENTHGDPLQSLIIGFTISFTSNLNAEEQAKLSSIITSHFGRLPHRTTMCQTRNQSQKSYVTVEGSHIERGAVDVKNDSKYIFTPSVRANLSFLARVVATGRFPILLEGETSAGKTSIIQYLANVSGNRIYRINNHENTDVQEYLGNYSPNAEGQLEFMEGVLLKAVRNGDWIILDELNLAPPAVLEALNRLLDDNREIFVPELNVAVSAHPKFQLFATQNPVGSYAGRKRLSRAFLNRFVIIKYDHLPFNELPQIVQCRCGVSLSMAEKMVEVLGELKARRSVSGIFSFANGLMTLRDLFRWGNRAAMTKEDSIDWRQTLADQGFFVLASRCRNAEDERTVVEVLQKLLKRTIDVNTLFSSQSKYLPEGIRERCQSSQIVLNYSMCRMLILVSEAWKCNEAVLLVGHTGCGKTSAACLLEPSLLSINCNERTETSDFLGSIRPTTDGLFQWNDGVVLRAMKQGKKLLIDEISLAPDSVLERLNSLLEPERSILPMDGVNCEVVKAAPDFQVLATMNPGDDHGKKEVSKALRNRFLEVWCPSDYSLADAKLVIERRLSGVNVQQDTTEAVSTCFVQFLHFFTTNHGHLFRNPLTTRDLISMVELFRNCVTAGISVGESILHAIVANLFDAFGTLPARMSYDRDLIKRSCFQELCKILKTFNFGQNEELRLQGPQEITWGKSCLHIGIFTVPYGHLPVEKDGSFSFGAPTSKKNAFRVARALVSSKPVMLEGSPGAGKSSLIVALAKATGNTLVRLNLSEQTDLSDLFGSDVPVVSKEGKTSFAWKDGPVLDAIKHDSWILLDEMNLASQPVLEGLNSCFDFRKNLFIAQLNKTFEIEQTKCRFFACQNPRNQGGDRKALPKSFLNRFTSIFVEEMSTADFVFVLQHHYGEIIHEKIIERMVAVNEAISNHSIREGGPFEFNLRDLLRWASASKEFDVRFGFEIIYLRRLRNQEDIDAVRLIYDRFFGVDHQFFSALPLPFAADQFIGFGAAQLDVRQTRNGQEEGKTVATKSFYLLASQFKVLQQLIACVRLNWLSLITGDCNSGKRSIVELLATLCNRSLYIMRLTGETDAMELLGSFEQVSTSTSGGASNIQFKWQNSEFVEAYTSGKWIFIEDVNSCSSAVLDCLNSCLEDGGHLVVPGCSIDGSNIIQKHQDFRAFFAMDPKNGKLSRAMRNRSVEIYMHKELRWNKNDSDRISVVYRQYRSCLTDGGRSDFNWISNSSSIELLRIGAMMSESVVNTDVFSAVGSSSTDSMIVERPLIIHSALREGLLSEYLSSYYWRCWEEVARTSADPLPAFVFAVLSSFDRKKRKFCLLDQQLMIAVEKYLRNVMSSAARNLTCNLQKLFEVRPCSSTDVIDSHPVDFVSLLRSFRKTAISESFLEMFASEKIQLLQLRFAEVTNKYQMSGPFKSLREYDAFVENAFCSGEEMKAAVEQSPNFLFTADFEEFLRMLSVLCRGSASTSLCVQGRRLTEFQKYIPWKSKTSCEAFCVLEVLNATCNFHSFLKTNVLDFISMPCYLTVIANKFWSLHGLSSLSQKMPLNKLQESGVLLNHLSSAFWVLTFLRKDIQVKKNQTLDQLDDRFCDGERVVGDSRDIGKLVELTRASLFLLKRVTPPHGLVDPIVAERVQFDYWKESLYYIDLYFCSIKKFLVVAVGGCDDVILEQRGNPIFQSLHMAKDRALISLSRLFNDHGRSDYYRPSSANFCELVEFLNSFTLTLTDTVTSLLEKLLICFSSFAGKETSSIALLPTQLSVFLQTCESFKQQLTTKFFACVDLCTVYMSVLNLLLLGVNRMLLITTTEVRNRQLIEKQGNLKVSLDLRIPSVISETLRLAIVANSCLSPQLQLESVLCHLDQRQDIPTDLLRWIESKWRHWYQMNSEKRDSLYILKLRTKDHNGEENGEEEITDLEDIELRRYLPDYGEEGDSVSFVSSSYGNKDLSTSQIMLILSRLLGQLDEHEQHEHQKVSYHSLMRIIEEMKCYDGLEDIADLLNYLHLIYLKKAENLLVRDCSKSAVIDVYVEGDYRESFRAMTAIMELRKRVVSLHQEFPENVVLSELLDRISLFCNISADAPLMKVAALLERVLTQSNEWQQLADRSRSIQPQMLALQNILLDWRRMEVRCWSELIKRIQIDLEEVSVLSSWPIFESLDTIVSCADDSQLVCNDEKILLMVIQWIHTSTLVDFNARLKSAQLLVHFVNLKYASGESAKKFSANLGRRVTSVIRHFKTFSGRLQERLERVKIDVEQQLQNFVDIFKYSDLNLWSIRQSTQKAHAQLFKIIKFFKENCREPVEGFLVNEMPQVPPPPAILSAIRGGSSSSSKFVVVLEKIQCFFWTVIDFTELEKLRNQADSFLSVLNQNVSYEGFDDEAKEKLQGRALFERQKQFAFLVRAATHIGLSSRRGMQISTEELTTTAISKVFVVENELGHLIRLSSVARNVFLKKFATAKVNQQEHLQKQVPVHVLTHLRGITEFGLHWILSAAQLLLERVFDENESFKSIVEGFKLIAENYKRCADFDYMIAADLHKQDSVDLQNMEHCADLLSEVVLCCPQQKSFSSYSGGLNFIAEEIGTNPLVLLVKESIEYEKLCRSINSVKESLERLRSAHDMSQPKSFGLCNVEKVTEYRNVCASELYEINQSLRLVTQFFPSECDEMGKICVNWISRLETPLSFSDCDLRLGDLEEERITEILLKVQKLVSGLCLVASREEAKKLTTMDAVKETIQLFYYVDFGNATSYLTQFLAQISCSTVKIRLPAIQLAYEMTSDLHAILELAQERLAFFLKLFSSCYISFESIGCHILTDGFVNPIPKAHDGSSENLKEMDGTTESNCGIGEGTGGDDDVSSQIENSGQIDGLKGDESTEQGNNSLVGDNQPIEMDNDFSANLEDIDGDANDDGEEQGDEGFENQVDWDKGQVEKADEQQLDPKLWDEKAIDEPKEMESALDEKRLDENLDAEEGSENIDENLADQSATQEQSVDKKTGFDNEQSDIDDSIEGDSGPADQEAMEINEGGLTADEHDADPEIDGNADLNDGTSSCEGGLEDTEEKQADQSQDLNSNGENPDVPMDSNEQTIGMDGLGQDSGEQRNSEDKQPGEGKPDGTEADKRNREKRGLDQDGGNDDRSLLEPMEEKGEVNRLVSENMNSKVEQDNVIEAGEQDDEGEALGYHQAVNEQERYVVQNSSVEEATKTRDFFQRHSKRLADATRNKESRINRLQSEVQDQEQPLSFSRHKQLGENSVSIVFDASCQLDPSVSQIARLQEKFEELDAGRDALSLELKWSLISESVSNMSSALAENLRMIIEPSVASRLQGDYRTGKRLNVRRLIAYIASDYRKDRIWMRRTKKVKRNYQICIAVDDSASMKDNLMTEITCHALCLIEKAFRQLEVGQLSICKFGKAVKVITEFSADAGCLDGAKLLAELTFKQDKTDLSNLLAVTGDLFLQARQHSQASDQMLIILSDGRGVMSDGLDRVRAALGRLIDEQVTVLFLIIDNGEKSILDVKVAKFTSDGRVLFESYMEKFPFPFFAIVNKISMLPSTIAEAVRQWFELTCR